MDIQQAEEQITEKVAQQVIQQPQIQQNSQDIQQDGQNLKQDIPSEQTMDIKKSKTETQKDKMNDELKSQLQSQQQSNQEVQKNQKTNADSRIDDQKTQDINEEFNSQQEDQSRIVKNINSNSNSNHESLKYANVLFYAGEQKSNFGRSEYIGQIHSRYKNYKVLEHDHAYIQWIFPNKYQSKFNNSSKALSDDEIEIFMVEPLLAKRIVKSYEIMLDFYGMSIKSYITGELKRNENYKERYEDAVCGHNVLRIRRILTSLSNLGFRKYAIQLCNFLQKEIKEGDRPLRNSKGDYLYAWQMYEECKDKGDEKVLENNCFQKIDQINRESIFFTMGLDKQMQESQKIDLDQSPEEIQEKKQQKKSF
ncbi:hypothetical protein ABPG72_012250 [Tetrahymena utriculariae]